MKKQLFFDDSRLFARENVIRKYGVPKLTETIEDPVCNPSFPGNFVLKLDDGRYRWIVAAPGMDYKGMKVFSYISEDGVHFAPEKLREAGDGLYAHELLIPGWKPGEIAFIYEDPKGIPSERYKMLVIEMGDLWVDDLIYTSPDLLSWRKLEGVRWADGAEPLCSVFYNRHTEQHTIIERPFWGIRRVGLKTTKDWKNFSPFHACLNVDSLDEPLSETYGMYAFEYEGMYIGLPHIYRGLHNEYNAKYHNGFIDSQLAYSYDGEYWQRSLREPFLSGLEMAGKPVEERRPMVWCFSMIPDENGDLRFYCAASRNEHGSAFHADGRGELQVYGLRRDGFIAMVSEDKAKPASVATREKVWHGGELHVNLKAKEATVAVRIAEDDELVSTNVLGFSKPLEGYGHEDCVPFSGDCTDWVPEFKDGKTLSDLAGKVLVLEVKFTDGELYSFSGDFTDVMNTEAARYRKFGLLPR